MFFKTISLIIVYLLSIQIVNSSSIKIVDSNICKSDEKSGEKKTCEIKCLSEISKDSLFFSIISSSFLTSNSHSNSEYLLKIKIEIEPKFNSPPHPLV